MHYTYLLPRWMQRTLSRFFQYVILLAIVLLIVVEVLFTLYEFIKQIKLFG